MNLKIQTLNKDFQKLKSSGNISDLFNFCEKLLEENSLDFLEFHYTLLSHTDLDKSFYNLISVAFKKRYDIGENFLLDKIKIEKNPILIANILQILGSFKNGNNQEETHKLAKRFLTNENEIIRTKALWVIGRIGDKNDLKDISNNLYFDKSNENRAWAASSMMQIFFKHKEAKDEAINFLKESLKTEKDLFALHSILIAIQEISGKNLYLSPYSKNLGQENEKIQKALKRVQKLILKNEI